MIDFGMHCHLLLRDLFWSDRDFRDIYRELDTPALERGNRGLTPVFWSVCRPFQSFQGPRTRA
jgi:hypothetical protein